jgi:hypothetical protein
MEPHRSLDKFRQREIEQHLSAEIQSAKERLRTAATEEEKRTASQAFDQALQRFTDFAAKQIVPKEFL